MTTILFFEQLQKYICFLSFAFLFIRNEETTMQAPSTPPAKKPRSVSTLGQVRHFNGFLNLTHTGSGRVAPKSKKSQISKSFSGVCPQVRPPLSSSHHSRFL
jgi:hypothetical protein